MDKEFVRFVVKDEILKLETEFDSANEELNLSADLGLDSLDCVEIVLGIERRLKVSFPDNAQTEGLKDWSVKELIEFTYKLTQ